MELRGETLVSGIDLWEATVEDVASIIWWWATRNADEKGKGKLERELWRPPKGEKAQGVWSAESETAALAAFKAQTSS